ncbi:glycerophosphodiester phosphodiesterase [Paenibacillus sp. GCM10027628]|uniref:glycerophosphodiester phosphodiesterase n=1 Tax=Paenibacillus sp. GCM10027628 TaxID=3273413 RepID=UPI00363F714A
MIERFPLITAHSGCMNTLDNTLLSVETGIRLGADIVEEDVRVTIDGVPVLAHDDALRTVDCREYLISQTTYAEISELLIAVRRGELHETMQICRLEDMLPLILASGKTANLDLKVDDAIEPVADLVKKYNLLDQVFLSGCESERAMIAQRTHPELRKLLNADSSLFLSMAYGDAVVQTCVDALASGCFGININYRLVRPELLEYAADKGLPVYVWTLNDEYLMRQFIDMGVASITARNVLTLIHVKEALRGNLS